MLSHTSHRPPKACVLPESANQYCGSDNLTKTSGRLCAPSLEEALAYHGAASHVRALKDKLVMHGRESFNDTKRPMRCSTQGTSWKVSQRGSERGVRALMWDWLPFYSFACCLFLNAWSSGLPVSSTSSFFTASRNRLNCSAGFSSGSCAGHLGCVPAPCINATPYWRSDRPLNNLLITSLAWPYNTPLASIVLRRDCPNDSCT